MNAALRADLYALLERADHEIDKDWIEGIRKGWKALVKDAAAYPDRVLKDGNPMTQAALLAAVNGALRYMLRVQTYLDRLRSDLLINKGLWSQSSTAVTAKTTRAEIAAKVAAEFDAAKEAVNDALAYARSFADNPAHYHLFDSPKQFDFGIRGIGNRVGDAMAALDKIVSGKLLRHLATVVGQLGGTPLGRETIADTVTIGKLMVTFLDTPLKAKYLDPEKTTAGEARSPQRRESYLKAIYKAQALLNKRGLGKLWYGSLLVLPRAKVDVAAYQATTDYAKITAIAATYSRSSDTIRVYADDLRTATIVHEMGHRLFYKFLTAAGRAHFDQWFGKVDPTSAYGGTNSAEDFAEAFVAYVKGKGMSRDQLDRFKSVLDPKATRTERRDLARFLRALVA